MTVERTARWSELADAQISGLPAPTFRGVQLREIRPLSEVLAKINTGNAERLGIVGEMLAVRACVTTGLRVIAWRKRTPVELDLIAERTWSLCYQRWDIQEKNTSGDLNADRVDREVGAVAGTCITHVPSIVPRASMSKPAEKKATRPLVSRTCTSTFSR